MAVLRNVGKFISSYSGPVGGERCPVGGEKCGKLDPRGCEAVQGKGFVL